MNIPSVLHLTFLASISFFLISCSSEEEGEIEVEKTNILPGFHDLNINFTQTDKELGVVSIQPNDLTCRANCTSNIADDVQLDLIATPISGARFIAWGGDCSGNNTCQVTMSSEHTVTATFSDEVESFPTEIPSYPLSIQMTKGGTIDISDGLLECISDCGFSFNKQEILTLKAIPDTGYVFIGWGGDCEDKSTCEVTMSSEHSVTASFSDEIESFPNEIPIYSLAMKMTTGGSIDISDGLLECISDCEFSFNKQETLILNAIPDEGYVFIGWGGDCEDKSTCEVTMSSEHSVTASFSDVIESFPNEIPIYPLVIQITKGGSIDISDGLLECISDCEFSFNKEETLTLKATPDEGYIFTGWGGDCEDKSTCEVTMSSEHSVTATFSEIALEASLSVTVDKEGTVSFSNNLDDCILDCKFDFTQKENITLTAIPKDGYVFHGWNGDCAGYSDCLINIDMTSNLSVTAIFKPSAWSCTSPQAPLPASSFDADSEYAYNNPTFDGSKVETLLTDFVVKESSGKGATNYPVSMVFPVEQGEYFHPGDFHIKNSAGEVIPAQFNVINRWWAKDRSLRHIQAHFNVDIKPYTVGQANTGLQTFTLYAGNGNIKPNYSVCTTETDKDIVLDNGLVDITITKSTLTTPLTITTPAGQLKSLFVNEAGEDDYSFDHDNITIELEEIGYLRTIVKISSLTNYVSPTDIKHGWALRLYMYADSDKVKVDFQLQNSAINTQFSAPLYFESHELILDDTGSDSEQAIKADFIDGDKISAGISGVITTPQVNAFYRNFWQKFPQGLATNTDGNLAIELWPAWSKQFLDGDFAEADLYWLGDMTQTYKEVLLDFSTQNDIDYLDTISRNFQFSPVASIPQSYYAKTKVTLELGGYFPLTTIPTETSRTPQYVSTDFTEKNYLDGHRFGADNFGLDLDRKHATNGTGGWAYSQRRFLVTGNPDDYYSAQRLANAELNIRPQWLSGYIHEDHFSSLTPSANPYGGSTWRSYHLGNAGAASTRSYIAGSELVARPRDDQHAWFYHMEHAYLLSGNKWLKDWFEFMGEFKQVYLNELDPWPDRSRRSEGHNLSVALSAYRVTGNIVLGELLSNYTTDIHSKYIREPHNLHFGGLWSNPKASGFMLGYISKPFIELTYEFPNQTKTMEFITSIIDWNYTYGNYGYYRSIEDFSVTTTASGSSLTLVDSAIWYSMYSGDDKYADHAKGFVEVGIGGRQPYGTWSSWLGQYEAQIYNYYLQTNQ